MKSLPRNCDLVRPELALYARGLLDVREQEAIAVHLEQCPACAEDAAFSVDLEQALHLEASESPRSLLTIDFTARVMTSIAASATDAPRSTLAATARPRVLRLHPARRSWTVLAAAAGLLAILSLAYRGGPAISVSGAAGGAQAQGTTVASANEPSGGAPVLMAQLKAALDVCGETSSATAGRAGWGNDRDLFGDLNEDGARAVPRQDPFYLNDPYATLFSDMLPRFPIARS